VPALPANPGSWARSLTPHGLVNDLEAPVIERHPLVAAMKQRLQTTGAVMAAMTGSGSTVFGVFLSRSAASAAAKSLSRDRVRVLVSRFRPRRS
jgi:4-diphosphocytidyl-2C-methyl-D-erythritol kinase